MRELLVVSHVGVALGSDGWQGKNRVIEVVEQLADAGWAITLLAPEVAPASYLTAAIPENVSVIPARPSRLAARTLMGAKAALVFGPSLRSYLATVVLGRRAVLYVGNAWALQRGYGRTRLRLERLAARRAAAVVAAGDAVTSYFASLARSVHACVPLVPPEVGSRLRDRPRARREVELRVVYVGSLSTAKGVPAILDAAEQLPEVDFRLIGAGEGTEAPALRDRVAATANVTLVGYCEWDALRTNYEWGNVLLLPSSVEGFPRVAYEAAAFGLALVISPVGGVPHRLADGRDALFVSPNDGVGVTDSLRRLAADPDLRVSLALNAAEALAPVFKHPSAAAQLDSLLRQPRALRGRSVLADSP